MMRYYDGGTTPWVKSGELREQVIMDTQEHVTEAALKETGLKLVPSGALLLAMYGATVGRLGILGVPAATNQAVCHIIPDPQAADIRYLFHMLAAQVTTIVARGVGGAQPNISQGLVKNLTVPLPPLTEQRRIAEVLDRADALRAKRREAIARLDALTQSIFFHMFGNPATNPNQWPEADLGDIAEIVSGITKGRKTRGVATRTVPYLAVANVQDRALALTLVKTIEATDAEIKRYRLQSGDLLLTEGGDPDKLGRGTLWEDEIAECIHQNHIFRVRLRTTDRVRPVFLNWLVGSDRGKRYFLRSAKQTTGIASINMQQLRRFPLFVPPVALQDEFIVAIRHTHSVRLRQTKMLGELDALFASLQNLAFWGQL